MRVDPGGGAVVIDGTNATTVFKALSDMTRLRILRLLCVGRTETCVCELVDALQERQYNVSRHLRSLESVGLLRSEKEGRWVYYGLADESDTPSASLHSFVSSLPDADGRFAADAARFAARMDLRSNGRCRVGILDGEPVS